MTYTYPLLLSISACVLLAFASLPLFRAADAPPKQEKKRDVTLDGLRGVLAYAVFAHHAVIYREYIRTGQWSEPTNHFFEMLGPLAVCVFFMITGYLFFSQIAKVRGQVNWRKFYVARIFRVGPLYLVAVLLMLSLDFASHHFVLVESGKRIAMEITSWMSLGLASKVPVNGDKFPDVWLAGVTWTIQYEWFFYLALLPLSLVARRLRFAKFALPIALLLLLVRPAARLATGNEKPGTILVSLFLAGMICALWRDHGSSLSGLV